MAYFSATILVLVNLILRSFLRSVNLKVLLFIDTYPFLFELSHIREITKYRLNSSKHVWVLFEPGVKVKVKAHACRCEDRSFVAFFFSLELLFLSHW